MIRKEDFFMQNRYTMPNMIFYTNAEDILMLSSETPGGGGSGSGAIELPPIPMNASESYAPPALSVEDMPTDILMESDEESSGGLLNGGSWGGNTNIELPPMQMG
ncbi:MAG: hypothetical protein IJ009_01290 [Clostridia bacterium]|nr:hypothetical protein [Clostridia bacterium]